MPETIRRIPIYSPSQRIVHAVITLSCLFLLGSGWLIQHSDVDYSIWSDWHSMIGQALLVVLGYRFYLMFTRTSGNWRLLLPTREQRHIVRQTLRFYASLGRLPCPDWYAFNPVWQPVYVVMLLLILCATLSGMLIGQNIWLFGEPMSFWHTTTVSALLYLIILHIGFVLLHDIKGNGGHISAMLNGYKYFHIQDKTDVGSPSVSLNELLNKQPARRDGD